MTTILHYHQDYTHLMAEPIFDHHPLQDYFRRVLHSHLLLIISTNTFLSLYLNSTQSQESHLSLCPALFPTLPSSTTNPRTIILSLLSSPLGHHTSLLLQRLVTVLNDASLYLCAFSSYRNACPTSYHLLSRATTALTSRLLDDVLVPRVHISPFVFFHFRN